MQQQLKNWIIFYTSAEMKFNQIVRKNTILKDESKCSMFNF